MAVELWIPPSAEQRRRVWRCETCGTEYPMTPETRRKRHRHAIRCADVNEEVLMEEMESEHNGSIFTNRGEDTMEYLEKRQKALREGTKGKGLHS